MMLSCSGILCRRKGNLLFISLLSLLELEWLPDLELFWLFQQKTSHDRCLSKGEGHAAPLMKLSHQLTKFGTKVTFVTKCTLTISMTERDRWVNGIRVISILDDLELESDLKDEEKLQYEAVQRVMPAYLQKIFNETNESNRISGVILDSPLAWMLDILKKMGLKVAMFWCSSPGCLALVLKIPCLIQSQFIDDDHGIPLKNENINLLPDLPPMAPTDLMWHFPSNMNIQKSIFQVSKGIMPHMINADWILCNWFDELHPSSHNPTPKILSIGPLLASGKSSGSFHLEDSTCLTWLDTQSMRSVVYVAFGSTSRFTRQQLDELALGLEVMGRPFLWVANSSLNDNSTTSYNGGVGNRGKIVEWAPQEAVLGHPSVACFITHCGWNSFMESLSEGVPLVCWPYFGDQLYTRTCVCDFWKVGLWLKPNENGIVLRNEIKEKVDEVLCNEVIRENTLRLKGMATKSLNNGGTSMLNIDYLVHQMKS